MKRVDLDKLSVDEIKETVKYLTERIEQLEEENKIKEEKWNNFVIAGFDYLKSTHGDIDVMCGAGHWLTILNAEDWKMFTERVGCITINYC
jgi:predicted AlkP superfamily phosphohydrolase/phosphomutase